MNPDFGNPAFWHRLHIAFTMIYHYLFPQLTMGLAWFIVFWKWKALRTGEERFAQAARFWAKIFGLNFSVDVVTGIRVCPPNTAQNLLRGIAHFSSRALS